MESVRKIVDDVMPPKVRQQYYHNSSEYAKKNPLVFSFLTTQAIFSAIPLLVFLFVSVSTLVLTIATALLTSITVISAAALATLPVLVLTISTATITWSILIASYITFNYIFNSLYVDSSVQRDFATIRKNTSQLKSEIDQNGEQEFNHYLKSAKHVGQEVNANAQAGYQKVKETSYDATNQVKKGAEKGVDKAANLANGFSNGADRLASDLFKDDGVVDGLKAKKSRVADGLNPQSEQNYAVKSY